MKIVIALAVCFGLSVFAKDRSPNQVNYPGLPAPTNPAPAPATPATGTFSSEDVLSSAAGGNQINVQSIVCVVSGTQPYTISTTYANDIRVSRVSSGGSISYEIYRGSRFLGACPAIHVISR